MTTLDKIRKLLNVTVDDTISVTYKENNAKTKEFCVLIAEYLTDICSEYGYQIIYIEPNYCGCNSIIVDEKTRRYLYIYINFYEKNTPDSLCLFTKKGVTMRRVKVSNVLDEKDNSMSMIVNQISDTYAPQIYCNIYEIKSNLKELMEAKINGQDWWSARG